jgi:putative FmdB family regulatory protein
VLLGLGDPFIEVVHLVLKVLTQFVETPTMRVRHGVRPGRASMIAPNTGRGTGGNVRKDDVQPRERRAGRPQYNEVVMPLYEYRCLDCARQFETLVTASREPVCPQCEGRRLEKQLSVFAVSTGGRDATPASGACGTCGDPRGPGACGLD